jgi:hypothetical protein
MILWSCAFAAAWCQLEMIGDKRLPAQPLHHVILELGGFLSRSKTPNSKKQPTLLCNDSHSWHLSSPE